MTLHEIVFIIADGITFGILGGVTANFFMNRSFWPFLVHRYWTKKNASDLAILELMQQSQDELTQKVWQAYQVVGSIEVWLSGAIEKPSDDEFARALDYFSADDFDEDFLPWPRAEQKVEAEAVQ